MRIKVFQAQNIRLFVELIPKKWMNRLVLNVNKSFFKIIKYFSKFDQVKPEEKCHTKSVK
jgi:hypothetical protein